MRRPGGSRDLVVVLVAGALMLLVAGATAVIAPPDEGLGVRGSSLSSGAAGGKAGFLLLRRLGYVVQRTFEPMVSLGANPATDVLVLMAPQQRPSDLDVARAHPLRRGGRRGAGRRTAGVAAVADQSGRAAVDGDDPDRGRRQPAGARGAGRPHGSSRRAGRAAAALRHRSTPTLAAPPSPRPGSAADA